MNINPTTTAENQEMIHLAIHQALHGATRNHTGLALLSNAYSFACFAAPDSDFETQICLAMQLVTDVLKEAEDEPEMMSFLAYWGESSAGSDAMQ